MRFVNATRLGAAIKTPETDRTITAPADQAVTCFTQAFHRIRCYCTIAPLGAAIKVPETDRTIIIPTDQLVPRRAQASPLSIISFFTLARLRTAL